MSDNTLVTPTQLAKGALRRLVMSRAEPTPANFARAYAAEAGHALPAVAPTPSVADGPSAQDWAILMERLVRGLESGRRQWSMANKKDSLQHVLASNRRDAALLHQRLGALIGRWERGDPASAVELADPAPGAVHAGGAVQAPKEEPVPKASEDESAAGVQRTQMLLELRETIEAALPAAEPRARELAAELSTLCERLEGGEASASLATELSGLCQRIRRQFGLRHEWVDELQSLCHALTDSITDLVDEESWAQGQARSLRDRLELVDGARSVRAVREMLDQTVLRQRSLRAQQSESRQALKDVLRKMFAELGELDAGVGEFSQRVLEHADSVQSAESLESLTDVMKQLVSESQSAHTLVSTARGRVHAEHERATALEARVRGLEDELQRMSEEAVTDSLTRVANRRGLAKQFEVECARSRRAGLDAAPLAIGLIDLDNFKKLNDSLGHAAGDTALQALAALVSESLRPTDQVARFGGEEFVVLLPATGLQQAVLVLTRLQRQLSAALFSHQGREVFVTFSGGVTEWRVGEGLDTAIERADEALYEAKRSGKNRTCVA
jgi:diguanylate cyclase